MLISMISSTPETAFQGNQQVTKLSQQRIEDEVVKVQQSHLMISDKAYHLSLSLNPESSPSVPNYGQYQKNVKAIVAYNTVSNLNNGDVSAIEAYAIKNNDAVRSLYLAKAELEHQKNMVESYIEQSQLQQSEK